MLSARVAPAVAKICCVSPRQRNARPRKSHESTSHCDRRLVCRAKFESNQYDMPVVRLASDPPVTIIRALSNSPPGTGRVLRSGFCPHVIL